MIAVPLDEGFRLARAPYWAWFIMLAFLNVLVDGAGDEPIIIWTMLAIFAGFVIITYGRVRDIGWHGLWTVLCLVPLFNIIIGFIPTKQERLTGATYREEKQHEDQA